MIPYVLLLLACHGSSPPAEPEPAGTPPLPPIDPDSQPSHLPPEPNSPGDARTIAPSSGMAAKTEPGALASTSQVGGMGGTAGFGGLSGSGGSVPVARP
jgi:hypothetical protein